MNTINSAANIGNVYQKTDSVSKQQIKINIHNASLNEVKSVLSGMMERSKITIKDMLPFMALEITDEIKRTAGRELHVQYYGKLWENPNKKQDLLKAFEEQKRNRADPQSMNSTKNAISLLKEIDNSDKVSSFQSFLNLNN